MAILEIVEFPNPVLKEEARDLEGINDEILKLIDDMAETMYHAPGVGLAANQIGLAKRLLVADISKQDEPKNLITLVNPRIIEMDEDTETMEEGCLSVPDFTAEVKRALKIKVQAKNLKGENILVTAEGFMARVLQHEIDHLNGKLFIDHIGRMKRSRYVKQRKKALEAEKK